MGGRGMRVARLELTWTLNPHLDPPGLTGTHLDSLGLTWTDLDSLGLTCTHLDSPGLTWTHLGSLGLTWTHLDSLGLTRTHLGSLGLTWIHLDALGLTWTHWILSLNFHLVSLDSHTHVHVFSLCFHCVTTVPLRFHFEPPRKKGKLC